MARCRNHEGIAEQRFGLAILTGNSIGNHALLGHTGWWNMGASQGAVTFCFDIGRFADAVFLCSIREHWNAWSTSIPKDFVAGTLADWWWSI
jgi:hypothetical protein